MMKIILTFFLSTVIGILAAFEYAGATSCARPTPAEHISNASIIFYGKVEDTSVKRNTNKIQFTNFKILRAYKGVESKTITIRYYNDNGANFGWGFKNGQLALVFARPWAEKNDFVVVDGQIIQSASYLKHQIATISYCSMIHFYGRPRLRPEYLNILNGVKENGPR